MRIGILSDTHEKLDRTRIAIELLRAEGAEVLFHCGDLTGPRIVAACAVLPFYFTLGNNDADSIPDLQRAAIEFGAVCLGRGDVVEMSGKRIGLVHGHKMADFRRIQEANPDYLLSGHSHICGDAKDGSLRRINPGALHRAKEFTVAVLDLQSDQLCFLPVPR